VARSGLLVRLWAVVRGAAEDLDGHSEVGVRWRYTTLVPPDSPVRTPFPRSACATASSKFGVARGDMLDALLARKRA
jgi:hypothetical protein